MPELIAAPSIFWLVWNPAGRSPSFRHTTEAAAIAEAERLAFENPGSTFIVLGTVCARRVDAMQRINMRAEPEIPF